jgi:hypothetical protein
MTLNSLAAALRACADGIYPLEAGVGLLIAHGTFLGRDDFTRRFILHGTSSGTRMAAIDWDAATTALAAGELPCSDLLTELLNVSAAQDVCASGQPIAWMSGRSESSGRRSVVASLITTETGHTALNQPTIFSSLRFFDVSCSEGLSALAESVTCYDMPTLQLGLHCSETEANGAFWPWPPASPAEPPSPSGTPSSAWTTATSSSWSRPSCTLQGVGNSLRSHDLRATITHTWPAAVWSLR